MDSCKLTFFLLTILIYLLYQRCNTEAFENNCMDDPNWFVEDKDGKKHICSDIGKSTSCYDRDSIGREGWERCLKTCGNCVNTKVTRLPQNILATFSGDPIEDFGVVLNIDKGREFVGKQDGSNNKGDIRDYIDKDKDEDISNIMDRLEATEDIFELITGNVISCKANKPGAVTMGSYISCDGTEIKCPPTPSPGAPTPTTFNYIRQNSDGDIVFPARQFNCKSIPDDIKGSPDKCKEFYLFNKIIDRGKDTESRLGQYDKHKITLQEVCPRECGVTTCPGHYSRPPQSNKDKGKSDDVIKRILEDAGIGAAAGGLPGSVLGGLLGAAIGYVETV